MAQHTKPLDSVLIKPAGPDCNLACLYCFYLEKERMFPEPRVHRMNAEVLEALVRQMMTRGGENVSFGWQGGEPTLMGVDFFKQAVEFEKRYGRDGQVVGNGLQTNGWLIDRQWCEFLKEARFLVGLSLDGPQHVHDHYRVTRGGGPTWQRVTEAARMMLDAGVEVNALTVLNEYSARFPDEIYDFHKEIGLTYMQFIPCLEHDPDDPTRVASFSLQPGQYGDFLCRLFDRWFDDFEDGQPTTFIRWFDSLFATYVGVRPPECTLFTECGNYVVVEHNGDVFACDFYVDEQWKLGNLLESDLAAMLNSPLQARFGRRKAALPHTCHLCDWQSHCRGGCPKERWGHTSGEKLAYFCEGYKMFFAHADSRFRTLGEAWLDERNQPSTIPKISEEFTDSPGKPSRNDPCPCGSGKKYKRCCGR